MRHLARFSAILAVTLAPVPAAADATMSTSASMSPAPTSSEPRSWRTPPLDVRDWRDGDPIPPGYRVKRSIRRGPVIGGAITLGITYLFPAVYWSATADRPVERERAGALWVPVAGPFIHLAMHDSNNGAGSSLTGPVFATVAFLSQFTGVTLLVAGLVNDKTVLVPDTFARAPKFQLMPAPMSFGSGSTGFGVVGTF